MVTEGRLKQKKIENQLKLEAKLHELEVLTTVTYLALELSLHNLLNDRTMLPNLAKSLLSLLVNWNHHGFANGFIFISVSVLETTWKLHFL